jgi:hypothetical protein
MAPTAAPTHLPTTHFEICRSTSQNAFTGGGQPISYRQSLCRGQVCNATLNPRHHVSLVSILFLLLHGTVYTPSNTYHNQQAEPSPQLLGPVVTTVGHERLF